MPSVASQTGEAGRGDRVSFGTIGRTILVVAALAGLAGCTREIEVKRNNLGGATNHVSPPPIPIPRLPPGTFDQARAHGEMLKAAAARLGGDLPGARHAAETAVVDWPADLDNWTELALDCRAAGDIQCALYAEFFRAKIEFVATQPPRVAVLGFATLAQGDVGNHAGDYVYDQRTLDTALRIASFYDERDTMRAVRPVPRPPKPAP
jgi:hypothetical protein